MSNRSNYRKNIGKEIKSAVKMTGVKKPKLTSRIGEEKMEEDTKKLRESVLNKLWDSLPPETQIFAHNSEDELDSDSTQSGLDEEEIEWEENSPKDPTSSEFKNRQMDNELEGNCHGAKNSQTIKSCNEKKTEDSKISWDTNLDFIQSIIWLKSTTGKLQRVPADEIFKTFQNQWESSPNIKSTNNIPFESHGSSAFVVKTNQRDKIDLIRYRLASHENFRQNQDDIVIPETDESGTPSLQSSQCVQDQLAINITVSESLGNSTTDSGFGSEKPVDSVIETTSSILETKYGAKLCGNSNRGSIIGKGCYSRKNPSGEILRTCKSGKKMLKRNRDVNFREASKMTIPKRPKLSISSASLNYVLRSSECIKVLLSSVRVILKFLESEKNGCYSIGNNWYESVQIEAIEAVVNTVNQLEKEKGSNSCRNEVVAMIKRVLEKMLQSSEVDKLSAWEHHRLVILELCNAFSVCKEIINYLISELKKLITIPIQTTETNMRESVVVMDKSYILFHSLKITLKKYRSFAPTFATVDEKNTSQKIPEVTDLWKRHWKVLETEPDIFVTALERLEIPEDPKEVWTRILEELVVVSTTIWPLVKILAWQCLAVIGR